MPSILGLLFYFRTPFILGTRRTVSTDDIRRRRRNPCGSGLIYGSRRLSGGRRTEVSRKDAETENEMMLFSAPYKRQNSDTIMCEKIKAGKEEGIENGLNKRFL